MNEGLNRQELMGNLGGDPELRFTQSGSAVLNMRIAATTAWKDREDKMQERTEWFSVVVWGKRGEGLAKILKKGSRIYVDGETRTDSYEDKDGVKRFRTEVHAKMVLLCGDAPRDERREEERRPEPAKEPVRDQRRDERPPVRQRRDERPPVRDERRTPGTNHPY